MGKREFFKQLSGLLAVLLFISQLAIPTAVKAETKPNSQGVEEGLTKVFSEEYRSPEQGNSRWWREGMVTGNGNNAALISGGPLDDSIIYQNISFNMPTDDIRETPKLSGNLENIRQNLVKMRGPSTDWELQYDYTYHPGHQLRLGGMNTLGGIRDYKRWTDYRTAEVGVNYTDDKGRWERRTFASRQDDVVITRISSSSTGQKVNLTLSIDDLEKMSYDSREIDRSIQYKRLAASDGSWIGQVAHYPAYNNSELKNGGFGGVTYVVNVGGSRQRKDSGPIQDTMAVPGSRNYMVEISGAEEVFLITASERDKNMGPAEEFSSSSEYAVMDKLLAHTKAVAQNPDYLSGGKLDYDKMLMPHAKLHQAEFDRVSFTLAGSSEDNKLSNEALIQKQQDSPGQINQAMAQRAFYAGRYAFICSSGYSTPRLGGIWTGAWGGYWQADWTTDANVNLQIAGANIGNMPKGIHGYLNFLLRIVGDWEGNAKSIYGMKDAIMAPPRTDGDRGTITHFNNDYPFHYWNSGASWLILPLYEYWLCYGDAQIPIGEDVNLDSLASVLSVEGADLSSAEIDAMRRRGYFNLAEDILLPLLTKQANFWEQLVSPRYYQAANGKAMYEAKKTKLTGAERYLILPSYSPENTTSGNYADQLAINSTMDISSARDGLRMAIEIETAVKRSGGEKAVKKWQALLDKLPEYRYDNTGALKEWALDEYGENHGHRHISHTYSAWPAHESQRDADLQQGIATVLEYRKSNANDKKAGHGWLHTGLVDARLGNSKGVGDALLALLSGSAYYNSMMTDHNITGDSAYCTDILNTVPAVIIESLLYSNDGSIKILPALPGGWDKGSFSGARARTNAQINKLEWDIPGKTASISIRSDIQQTIQLTSGIGWKKASVTLEGETREHQNGNSIDLELLPNETVVVNFVLDDITDGTYALAEVSGGKNLAAENEGNLSKTVFTSPEENDWQKWKIAKSGSQQHYITNIAAGKKLSSMENDTLALNSTGSPWLFIKTGDNQYNIVDTKSGLSLGIAEGAPGLVKQQDAAVFELRRHSDKKPVSTIEEIEITGNMVMQQGNVYPLKTKIRPVTAANEAVEWSSSNPDIAGVLQDGTVTPVALGKVTITAQSKKDPSVKALLDIEVKPGLLDAVAAGQTEKLTGEVIGRQEYDWERYNGPANLFDGDISTYYDGQEGGYAGLKLPGLYSLDGFRYKPRQGHAERVDYNQIQGSADGKNWKTLYSIFNVPQNGEGWVNLYFPLLSEQDMPLRAYSYYRVSSGISSYCNMAELEFFGKAEEYPPVLQLSDLIYTAEEMDYSPYTSASSQAVRRAMWKAKDLLDDGTASETAIAQHLADLKQCMDSLIKKSELVLNTDERIIKGDSWEIWDDSNTYSGRELYTNTVGDFIELEFTGTGIDVIAMRNPGMGKMNVYIDDNLEAENVSLYDTVDGQVKQTVYSLLTLDYGKHTIRIELDGETESSGGPKLSFDAFRVYREKDTPATGLEPHMSQYKMTAGEEKAIIWYTLPPEATEKILVSYKSSNSDVAFVDESGVIKALSAGSAVITIKSPDGKLETSCEVLVNPAPVPATGIEFNPAEVSLNIGAQQQLAVLCLPENTTENVEVSYECDNEKVAGVSSGGMVTAHSAGIANITATSIDKRFSARCSVKVTNENSSITGIELNKNELWLEVGASEKLQANFLPGNITPTPSLIWESSRPEVADAQGGLVRALQPGTANITASTPDGLFKAVCAVTVKTKARPAIKTASIKLNHETKKLFAGEYFQLEAEVLPLDADNTKVFWSSSNKAVAVADQSGKVHALKKGEAVITVLAEDGGAKTTCVIKVENPLVKTREIVLNMQAKYLKKGKSVVLKARVLPTNASDEKVVWKSKNTKVATVTKNGRVTAQRNGVTTITAKSGNKTAAVKITVGNRYKSVSKITLNRKKIVINTKGEFLLKAGLLPVDASNKKLTWVSSNTKVARVSKNGRVKGVGEGKAVITATSCESGRTARCTVVVKKSTR